ncbi:autotransporter-associated beta strand repeat-containing protein [Pseudomonas putida]|uniref:autotransporter-associated beta strand repeat-containing protein n=1 Tax=Pseudomonas putida TaxID=303 RepID=UPI003D98D72E
MALSLCGSAQAATLTWSPTGQNSGGTGNWDLSSSSWYNGTVTLPWNNLAGDSAQFAGIPGTVSIVSPITVQDLLFAVDGYTLQGGTLNAASSTMGIKASSGTTATINSVIAGAARVDVNGAGTIVLGGVNTYTGGTRVTNNGTLRVSQDSNLGAAAGSLALGDNTTRGTLAINGGSFSSTRTVTLGLVGGAIDVASGTTATFGGVISGSGPFTFSGDGTLVLTAANTYTGATTISSGTLQVGNGGATGVLGGAAVTNNGTLAFNRNNAVTYGGVISGTGGLTQIGTGTTILTGDNTYTGGTTINAGKLQIGNGGATGSIVGNVINNGELIFSRNNTYTYAGVISGTGAVQQNGGTTVLSGANTYTGETIIRSGFLQVASDGNLGASSSRLHFVGNSNFRASSAFTTAREVVVDSGVNGYVGSAADTAPLTLSGVVSGAGRIGVDSGLVFLTGNNTYTGGTNIWGGTLAVSSDSNLGAASGAVNFVNGGVLRLLNDFGTARNIVLSGNGFIEAYNGSTVTLNGTISGGGYLAMRGAGTPGGTVVLNGTNTYTGVTYLQGGIRTLVSNAASLGSAKDVNFGNGTLVTTSSFTINKVGLGNGGATIDVAPTTTLTVSGDIYGSSSALRKTNTGTLVLAGTSSSTSGFIIDGGTLQVGNGGTTGVLGTGNVVNNSALVFNRSDAYEYGGVISGSGTLTQSGTGTTTLTGSNSYTGATRVAAGSLFINGNQTTARGLTTVESGATLGGIGTIGGSVTVNDGGILSPGAASGAAGTLTIGGNLVLSNGAILNYNLGQSDVVGGVFNDQTVVRGNLTLDGTLNVGTTTGGTFDPGVYRIISYTGALTDNGLALGNMPAGSNTVLQTSINGQVNLINSLANMRFWDSPVSGNPSNGVVEGGSGIWNSGTGANSNWTNAAGTANGVYSPGFVVFQGSPGTVTVDNSGGQVAATGMQFAANGYVLGGGAIDLTETTPGSGKATVRVGDGTAAGSNFVATVGSVLQGSVGLVKTDRGTLVLSSDNTYTGSTTVVGGTLQLGNGGTSGSIVGDVVNSSNLAINRSDTLTVGGVISGTGTLQQIGTGTTVLTGNNTYGGATTIARGTLQVGSGGTTGTLGTGALSNNDMLAFNRSDTYTYGGVISGTGALDQRGTGTTVLTGNNTYTGSTTISAGTLQLGDGTANGGGSIAGNITNNATLVFNRNVTSTYAGVISGSGAVEQRSGTLTLSGANTYSGGTTLRGGTLQISSDSNLGDLATNLTFDGGALRTGATLGRNIVLASGGGLVYSAGGTFNGTISGAGRLWLHGGGTTTINGANTYTGGTLLTDGATVVINSASALGTGAITGQGNDSSYGSGGNLRTTADMTLANTINYGFTSFYGPSIQSLNFYTNAGTTLTLTGAIQSVGGYRPTNGLSKNDAGKLVLANTVYNDGGYAFRLNGGTLQVGDGGTRGTLGAAPVQTAAQTKLQFNRSDTYVYAGGISGAGAVEQNGTGTTVLAGANTHTGGTTINAGTLQIGNGGTTGSVAGNITNNSNLAFNRSDVFTFAGVVSGTGALQQNGTGTLVLTNDNTYTGGTTINAGTLQLGDGGTSGMIAGNIVNNSTLAFNFSDTHTHDGAISGTGGLLQNGLGTTILTGTNSYRGATTVSRGRLFVNGDQSAATGATNVAAAATLGGTGVIGGNVNIANDGILAPGSADGTGGTLTINGNLGLNATSILHYTFGALNGVSQNSLTTVNGNLTLDGRLDVATPAGGTFEPGIYRIFNYTGALTNNGLALGTLPPSTTVALQTGVPGQINLINTTGILTAIWDGSDPSKYNDGMADGGTGVWSRNVARTNWGDPSSSINSTYTPTSFVIFQGASGTVTVDKSYGDISASGIQFAVNGYSVSGDEINLVETASGSGSTTIRVGDGSELGAGFTATIGSILKGSTRVTKTDLGKLVLTGANTYSGGTAINGGTLSVSSDANLGALSGALSFDDGALEASESFATARATTLNARGGTFDVDTGKTLTMNGAVGGVGKLTKTDAGTLLLAGVNTYSGGTAINAGKVQVSSDANLGAASGTLSFDGGVLETTESFTTARATTLNAMGGTLDVDSGKTLAVNGVVDGAGKLTKSDAGTLVLAGVNTYSGGTAINGGKVQVSSDANLGAASGALSFDGGVLATTASLTSSRAITLNASGGTLDVIGGSTLMLTGVASGTGMLSKVNSGTLVLSSANTYSGGTNLSGGVLKMTNADGVGTGTVNINTAAGSTTTGLELALASASTFDNLLAGAGTTTVSGAQATISGANAAYTGQWNVTGTGTLAVADSATTSTGNLGTGGVDIAAGGIVNTLTTGAFSFDNALTGAGTLNASNANQAFSFGTGAGNRFAGTVSLKNNTFALSGNNTTALTNATLDVGAGNVTTVGAGVQNIGNLTINGGTMVFSDPSTDTVATQALTLTSGSVGLDPQSAGSSGNLLAQDEGTTRQLVSATSVNGSAANLVLKDQAGNRLTSGTANIQQGGQTVAIGTYAYDLATSAAGSAAVDGLYASYRLTQLALQAGQTTTLSGDGASSGADELHARLTGSGNLAIAATNTITLSNTSNDYSGETSVNSGTLRAGADNALGRTSRLNLANLAGFDLNGKTQTVGVLNGVAGSSLNLNNGTLELSNGGTSAGTLSGGGLLKVNGGTLDVQGSNTGLSADTLIATGAQVNLNHVDGLGSGRITDNGTLLLAGVSGALDNAIDGTGVVNLSNASEVTLAGNNTLSGSWNLAAGTRLTASTASNLGTAAINNAGTFNVDTGTDWTLSNALNGAGVFTKNGTGTLTIARANSATGATTILGGVLKLSDADGVGTGTVNIDTAAGSTTTGLELALASASTFDNLLAGAGTTTVSGAQATISGANAAYTGQWNVTGTGTLAVADSATTSTGNLGTGGVDIAAGGIVNTLTTGAFSFDNALTGAGTLNASNANQAFSFGTGAGNSFAGTVSLKDNTFALSGNNTTALTNATLEVGAGNVTTVGDGNQVIGGLNINGGTMRFNASAPNQVLATSLITAGTLDASHTGTVSINVPAPLVAPGRDTPNTSNLLTQDEANIGVQLVDASAVSGSGGAIRLVDQDGNVITDARQVDISQNGNTVAKGTYDFRLTTGTAVDGLYVNYGLSQLDLQSGQTLTLAEDTGAAGAAADMSAKITGNGNLAIDASNILTLSNANNDYSGETSVLSGTLRAGSDNALGRTSQLNLANLAGFDLNGKTQTVVVLNGAAGSSLNLNNGTLELSNGGTSAGTLSGGGQLKVNGGTLDVQGSNTGLSADTLIATGAQVNLNHVDGLGSSNITDNGTLLLDGASGTLDNAIDGTGEVNLSNASEATLTGNNTLSGSWNLAAGTRLTASTASNLGTAAINNAGTFNVDTGTDWTLSNALNGAGVFTKNGTGTLTIARANSATGATTILGGVLKLSDADGVGTGTVNIDTAAGSTTTGLELALASASTFDNLLAGAGTTTVSGAQATISGANAAYTGQWNVTDTGTLAVADSATTSTGNLGTGGVDIAAGGIVNTLTTGAFSFDNALTGAGTLNASNANQAFSFGTGAGNSFAGTVSLKDNTFALSGNNTTALTNATLEVGAGNVTTVGDGNQVIGGLKINGGTMRFNASAPDQVLATSLIKAGTLDASHTGTVAINVPAPLVAPGRDTPNTSNLLTQDEANIGVQLVDASTVSGSGGAIRLVDQDGNVITDARQVDISQDGNTVAKGTYDYRLTTGTAGDGLYVNYGLTQLDLQSGQTLTLAENTGAAGAAADMSAKITGVGSLAIDAADVLTLSNANNDYSGETSVNSGTLRAGADNALGRTSQLNLANLAGFDLNGKTQTVGVLNAAAGSSLNLNNGTLVLSNGGTSAGTLSGGGLLKVNGGTLDVQGSNTGLSADTLIATGAQVNLNHVDGLGSGKITDNGTLLLDGASGTLDNDIEGTGEFVKRGSGLVTLTGKTGWTGITRLEGGDLVLDGGQGGAQLFSNIVGTRGTSLSLKNGASLTGWIDPTNVNIDAASTWNMTADSLVDDVDLAGAIKFARPASLPLGAGRTLTARNWLGRGGTVELYTVLGDDRSASDRIVLDGGRATGDTGLIIRHAGGDGAQTSQGIRVVETRNGGTTDAGAFKLSTASDGYRAGKDTIAAGAYDYSLVRGGSNGVADDWYLTSRNSKEPATSDKPAYRPEVGAYLNNKLAASMMQVHTLHDRQSQASEMQDQDQNDPSDGNSFLRVVKKSSDRSGAGHQDLSDTTTLIHGGGDLLHLSDGADGSIRFGVMGAQHSSDNHADNGSVKAKGSVNGYSVGVYGTWYGHSDIQTGPYIDSWIMYGEFDNTVKGHGLASESYDSSNLSASLEAGYSLPVYQSKRAQLYIEPQAQVIKSNFRADSHKERNGTVVSGQTDTSVTTRLGVRLHADVKDALGMKPFAQVNWWHGPSSQSIAFDGVKAYDRLPEDRFEGNLGLQGNLSKKVSAWSSVGYEAGEHDYSASKVELGVTYSW